jgi:hypothetical protein
MGPLKALPMLALVLTLPACIGPFAERTCSIGTHDHPDAVGLHDRR